MILPRTIFFSIVVVVPVYFACVLYPASKIIIIIIINKCPYPLGPVSKVWIEILQSNALAIPSAPANSYTKVDIRTSVGGKYCDIVSPNVG